MRESVPTLLVPGLLCSPRLYANQMPMLWQAGPLMVADHTRDDSMAGIARRILSVSPPRFALIGLSMGGYIAFEILRQAAERVDRLALLDTAAPADTPQQTERRQMQMGLAETGRFNEIPDLQWPLLVHERRRDDAALKGLHEAMCAEVGAEAFLRQQTAILHRVDSRPLLASIRCPTLMLVGDSDQLTPPERAREIAEGIAGAKLVVVPECGHLSTLEQSDAVNQALRDWIA